MAQVKWERELQDREISKQEYVINGILRMRDDPDLCETLMADALDMLSKEFDSLNPLPAEGLSARVERLEKLVSDLQQIVTGNTTL